MPEDPPLQEPRLVSYPWYFDDWRGSEARAEMNSRERYLYRELLDYCWEKGSLPTEKQTLACLAGISWQEFQISWKRVAPHFWILEDGRYHHKKVDDKRNELIGIKLSRKEASIKAAKASASSRASRSAQRSHDIRASGQRDPNPSPSPSPSPSTTPTNGGSSVSEVDPDARANGTHTPPALLVIPAAVNDAMFRELIGAFLSLGVAVSETDLRTCGMLWVSLDDTAKRTAHGYALLQASSGWRRRTEEFIPKPWNYLRERHWERKAEAPGRKAPMSKAEAAHIQAAADFIREG